MMRVRIYKFNMIEVLLAIVVVTLAITGVFALFPVGLNASKNATADNSISDIAEYVIAHVRADVQNKLIEGDYKGFDEENIGKVFNKIDENLKKEMLDGYENLENYELMDGEPETDKNKATILRYKDSTGIYLIRQLSGPENDRYEDFTAYARVFVDSAGVDNDRFVQYNKTGKFEPGKSEFEVARFLVPVVLELSYPATLPYAEREKRYFRFEIFNHQYDPNAAAAAAGSGS